MKLKSLLVLSLVCLVLATGCQFWFEQVNVRPSGNVIREERALGNFHAVAATGMGELDITIGTEPSLIIEADDAVMPYLTSEIHNGTLDLGIDDDYSITLTGAATIRYNLTVTGLDAVTLSGMMEVTSAPLTADSLELVISGSGNMDIDSITADTLDVLLSGLGNLSLTGEVTSQEVEITGSGAYQAGDLRSQRAHVIVTGMGEATLWVIDDLSVEVSGSASIRYYGDPTLSQEITGIGTIDHLGDK